MKKLLVYFALVFVIVAGTAAVLTVVAPQSAVADGSGYSGKLAVLAAMRRA